MDNFNFLNFSPIEVAPRLLGCILLRIDGQRRLSGMIVETEAYDQTDVASHSYRGETPRTKVMFGTAGSAYVYFTYGMHYCLNVVTSPVGYGAAVLIRAVEPIEGKKYMFENRNIKMGYQLTNGPAKLCQAFKIDNKFNGHNLSKAPLQLIIKPPVHKNNIIHSSRIGISQGEDLQWRFYLRDNLYVSRP
jgi:DNA-3-methyladenine glycosylase